jgi:nitrous oxide reductase accessory protein NosL
MCTLLKKCFFALFSVIPAHAENRIFSRLFNAFQGRMTVRQITVIAAVVWVLSFNHAGAAETKFTKPADRDKCPVCGMFVAKYPDWIAEVVFKDGSYAVFDGPKDLFKFIIDLKRYAPGKGQQDIDAVFVSDYYAVRPVDGRKAFYVLGSDVYGPMGRELVPFENEADAREFMKDHRGRKILRFDDISSDILKPLD